MACSDADSGNANGFTVVEATSAGPGPAGATCTATRDCREGQVCSAGHCKHQRSSSEGEILIVGAENQVAAGDLEGALQTFEQARVAFDAAGAPLPPELACGSALAALRLATDPETRERGAQKADRCFRNSVPGFPLRAEVQGAVARLRFDGIDLALFDAEEPPMAFFVEEPTRPTADAIQVSIDLPSSDVTGFPELRDALLSEKSRVAISECFVKDWESRHERSVSAGLVLRFRTRLRDMGDYDAFGPEVSVTAAEESATPFAGCLAASLTESLQPGPRIGRVVGAWQEAFHVQTSVP